jgi:2-dehydro-3-deoxyphosphogluconate aldolase/(4S)-4-hydroxy-2-oxoglutarate aldolase
MTPPTHRRLTDVLRVPTSIAVLRCADAEAAVAMAEGLVAGSLTTLEVTLTTPGALTAIRELARLPGVTVGVGTVTDGRQVSAAVDAGARFVVSPGLAPDIIDAATACGVPAVPGVLTPTEAMAARVAGAAAVKLFPAGTAGVRYLRALREVFPDLDFVPTGGIAVAEVEEWFAAGAYAVGVGGELTRTWCEGGSDGLKALAVELGRRTDAATARRKQEERDR